jgi:signal transduction histidine kinase/ActR/RegA family two-component response regulator
VDIDETLGCGQVLKDHARAPLPSLAGEYLVADFPWTVSLLKQGSACWIEDTQTSPLLDDSQRRACAALGIVAWLGAPVVKEGRLVGALCVAEPHPRSWTAGDVWVLQEAREKFWYTLARARAEETLRERTEQLEKRTQQLRWLASELTLAEHQTREQLSKTLHDHLQQLLFSASLTLQSAIQRIPADPLLVRAQSEISEAMAAARNLSSEIFPPVLRTEGLAEALTWLAQRSREKFSLDIRVEVDPLADPLAEDARILLFESVRELIFNAAKHAAARQVTVRSRLESGDRVSVSVTDDGQGFDPEIALGPAARHHGMGLFSIGERLSFLGGGMHVDSAAGHGACFTLTLPRRYHPPIASSEPVEDPPLVQAPSTPDVAGPAQEYRLRILLADDHALVREGLRKLLCAHPELKVVAEAADGQEALRLAHQVRPDVVVMDVSMPVLDGVQATRRLRAELPDVRVFGLSTQESHTHHPIERAGAHGYFSKRDGARDLIGRLLADQRDRASAHLG